jgi:glycosyltransferase involved in cell wall biosynthesis
MSKVVEEGLAQDRIRHLPLFVDSEKFHPAKEKQEYFLYCGRLEKMKGLHILIQAMAQLRKGRLVILGEGPLRQELERQIRKEKLERHVRFLGYQSGESLLKLIREALFLVIPSQWFENQPLTILEAHASGTAVVGSNLGGIAEMVNTGEDGLLFDYTNPADLAEKIDFMIKNPASAKQMGLRGRARISQEHCKEPHMQRLIGLYQQLITSSNSS